MNMTNINKYLKVAGEAGALLIQAATMYSDLRKNPPDDPTEYMAAFDKVGDLKRQASELWDEARDLLASGDLTAEDIAKFRKQDAETLARNVVDRVDPMPAIIDTAPPILPVDPPALPVIPPVSYGAEYPYPIPSDDELKSRGYVAQDRVERRVAGNLWRVMNTVEGGNVWKLDHIIT